jgi:hypothetical protein
MADARFSRKQVCPDGLVLFFVPSGAGDGSGSIAIILIRSMAGARTRLVWSLPALVSERSCSIPTQRHRLST